jgi:hypothetical protein
MAPLSEWIASCEKTEVRNPVNSTFDIPRGHCEFPMLDLTEPADMASDWHVVGRVGKDHLRAFVSEESHRFASLPAIPDLRPLNRRIIDVTSLPHVHTSSLLKD